MKKYMDFKRKTGECEISYTIKGLEIIVRGRGISETAKEVAKLTNEIYNTNFLF